MVRMMRWGLAVAGVAIAGLIAVAAVGVGGGASAQTPPAEDTPDDGMYRDRYEELLAEGLGISVDDLLALQTEARNQVIDEMLAAGDITEEQAEELKAREFGEGRGLGFGRGFHAAGALHRAIAGVFETASDIVGVPVEELRERIAGGESLVEIADGQGMDEATLKSELVTALTDKINQAVADGDLEQDKADRLLENLDAMVERAINAEGPFDRPMRDGDGFRFGGR